jgi:preprotein translocase subunit SecF
MIFLKKVNNPIFLFSTILLLFAFSMPNLVNAQALDEEVNTLNKQYETLMKVSTTYQEYKVIKHVRLNEFWKNIQDSIQTAKVEQQALKQEITDLNADLLTTQNNLGEVTTNLEASNHDRDRIDFIGIPLTKAFYNSVVWGIIFILGGLALLFFYRFNKSNTVTRITKKEADTLFNEYDNYKKNTRDKELQLKRELQTAINTSEDLKL